MRLFASSLLLIVAATAPALPNEARLEQRQRAKAESTDEIVVYKTKPGETLQSIAEHWFVRPEDWRRAQALNKISNPGNIPAGTALRLRSVWLKTNPIVAELSAFRGDVRISRLKAAQDVAQGMELKEGDLIETGVNGFATLSLPDGSQVSLPSASRIRLARLRQVPMSDSIDRRFTLEHGRSEAKVTPMANPASRFLITTPVAVAAVRGTRYRVTYTPSEFKAVTEVTEGKVAVSRVGGIEDVLVRANFGNITTSTGATRAFALLPAPVIETPERLQDEKAVKFQLSPVEGATRYLVEIATDPGFIDRVGSREFEGTIAEFDGVPDGDYYVRAFAIDGHGLTGVPTEHQFPFRREYSASAAAADAEEQRKSEKVEQIAQLGEEEAGEFEWFAGDDGNLMLSVAEGSVGGSGGGSGGGEPLVPLGSEVAGLDDPFVGGVDTSGSGGGFFGGGSGGGFAGGGAGGGGGGRGGGGGGGSGSGGSTGSEFPTPPSQGGGSGPAIIPENPVLPGEVETGGGELPGTGGKSEIPETHTGTIPEPASWAMMIVGFGAIGLALRRRRIAAA